MEDLMTSKESAENAIKTLMGEGESIAGKMKWKRWNHSTKNTKNAEG